MKTRAAVAFEAGKPLEVVEVDLEGPKAGEVLVEIKATGICHTDEFTKSGADPEGAFPAILGHEGAGVVVEVGAGVTSVEPGDHVIPLYTAECRTCDFCLNPKTNLCQSVRETQGRASCRTAHPAFLTKARKFSIIWGAQLSQIHPSYPKCRSRRCARTRPSTRFAISGCGVTTGVGAVMYTAKVEPKLHRLWFSASAASVLM